MTRLKADAACEPAALGLPSTRLKAYRMKDGTETGEAEQTEYKHTSAQSQHAGVCLLVQPSLSSEIVGKALL